MRLALPRAPRLLPLLARHPGGTAAVGVAMVLTVAACGDDPTGLGAGCRVNESGTSSEVRFHVVNVDNEAGIRVEMTVGGATCIIDPLPTSTTGGLELGQFLTTAAVGTTISVSAQIDGSAAVNKNCTVTQDAFDPGRLGNAGQVFMNVLTTTVGAITGVSSVICDIGLA